MRTRTSVVFALVLVVISGSAIAVARRIPARALSAEVMIRNEDFEIPGITKTYEARLTNRSFLPVRVTRCDFVDDTFSRGTMVGYALQRWSQDRKQWVTEVQFERNDFCKP